MKCYHGARSTEKPSMTNFKPHTMSWFLVKYVGLEKWYSNKNMNSYLYTPLMLVLLLAIF